MTQFSLKNFVSLNTLGWKICQRSHSLGFTLQRKQTSVIFVLPRCKTTLCGEEHFKFRVKTLSEQRKKGKELYPHSFVPSHSLDEFVGKYSFLENEKSLNDAVTVAGRVFSIREASKKLKFYDIMNEGTNLQVIANFKHYANQVDFYDDCDSVRRGDIIGVIGTPMRTKRGELSVNAENLRVLSPCLRMLPNNWEGLANVETRFRKRHIDLIMNRKTRDIFVTRSKIISFLRKYLENLAFIEVETPMLVSQDSGSNAIPFRTYHNALNLDLFLRIAPEMYLKMLVVGGMNRVFEIGRQFRNEGIDRDHNPEFTMVEFYMAFADYFDLMNLTESLLSEMALTLFGTQSIPYRIAGIVHDINLKPPFPRIKFMEALESAVGMALPPPDHLHTEESRLLLLDLCRRHDLKVSSAHTPSKLLDKLSSHLVEASCIQPTFIVDHPQMMSPMAKSHRSMPGLTERFELFAVGKELCNAYTELNDSLEQRARFQELHKGDGKEIEQFCNALDYGLPPTAGSGMGIDRLVMLFTNSSSIKDVLLFPLLKPKCDDRLDSNSPETGFDPEATTIS